MMKNNTPKLRFKEFTYEWQEKKLGDIVEFKNGKAHEKDISEDGKYIVINSKFVSTDGRVKKFSDKQICPVYKNDIVMVMSDIPNGKAIAKCFFVKNDNRYTLNQRICSLTAKKNISSPSYLASVINRNKFYLKFDDGVSQTNLKRNDVLDLSVLLPEIEEQEKIARFLTVVDEKISHLEAKKTQFEKYKKGVMQAIFSQKIRFKDENGKNYPDWENKKLKDFLEYKNGGSFEDKVVVNGKYYLVTLNSIDINGNLQKTHKRVDVTDNSLKKGDLVMVLSDIAHGNFLGLTDIIPADNYVLNQRMGALKPKGNGNSQFLRIYINYNQKYFKRHGQGTSQQNLAKGDIENFKIQTPILGEQEKIAGFLTSLNNKIDLINKELEQAKEFKKGLLQQMFV